MAASGNSTGLYVMGAVVAAIVIGIVVYYVARMMKGRLKLIVPKTRVQSGETFAGSLLVQAKRSIEVDRMYVALIGERLVRRRSSGSSGSSTSWVEFYRDEADVAMDEVFPPGFSKNYQFSLTAPTQEQLEIGFGSVEQKLDAAIGDIDNPLLKGLAAGAKGLAKAGSGLNRGRKRWKLIARLETKGVDLADSQTVHVSLT